MDGGGRESEQAEDPRGVDLTLVRWMLDLTPAQRVEHIQGLADSLDQIRRLNGEPELH